MTWFNCKAIKPQETQCQALTKVSTFVRNIIFLSHIAQLTSTPIWLKRDKCEYIPNFTMLNIDLCSIQHWYFGNETRNWLILLLSEMFKSIELLCRYLNNDAPTMSKILLGSVLRHFTLLNFKCTDTVEV